MSSDEKVNILVVDDSPDKLLTMRAVLEQLNENVVTVSTGREALRSLLNDEFAVILLDVNMPDMDGFETAALIRERKKSEHTPIIFVTAFGDEAHAFQGYSLGAVDYILTPVVAEILRAKVAVFVDLFRKTQQVKRQAEERAALAIAQAERATAEEAAQRAAFLADASTLLARSLDFAATQTSLLQLAVPTLGDWCALTVFDDQRGQWQTQLAWVDPVRGDRQQLSLPYTDFPAGIVATIDLVLNGGASEVMTPAGGATTLEIALPLSAAAATRLSTEATDEHNTGQQFSPNAIMVLPLQARGTRLGAITLALGLTARRYTAEILHLADELAGRASIAIDNARLYREIQAGDRRKDEFLAMLGHELRNPLAAIANALEYVNVANIDPDAFKRAQGILGRQVQLMARLVDDLLDVSRITRGKIELRKEVVELESAISRAVATTDAMVAARQHELQICLPDEKVLVMADPARLEQILANLLNNAAKYTDPGGKIWLKAECLRDELLVSVRDTGVGIPEQLLPRIFDLFMQGDRSLDRAQGGLGIGLTLVRSLVEMHGGKVEVRSHGLGHGSEFIVRLPRMHVEPERTTNGKPLGRMVDPTGRSRRVLLVDDNVDLTSTMSALLRLGGHDVHVCCDGPTALEAASEYQPEVVLIDIGLPGMNGYEVAQRLRQTPNFESILLIAMTGYGQAEDRRQSREAGFDHHLVKPVFFDKLQQLLTAPTIESHRPASERVT